jgi:predicted nucleotidyltransferase
MKQEKHTNPFSKLIQKRKAIIKAGQLESDKKKKAIMDLREIFEKYRLNQVFLFGSVLNGKCYSGSDIDLYVEEVSGEIYWALKRELEKKANQPIDLYCQLDDRVFISKIKKRGELIYESGC